MWYGICSMNKVFMYESVDDYCIQMNYRFRLYYSLLPKYILFLFCSCDRNSEIQTCHKKNCAYYMRPWLINV